MRNTTYLVTFAVNNVNPGNPLKGNLNSKDSQFEALSIKPT